MAAPQIALVLCEGAHEQAALYALCLLRRWVPRTHRDAGSDIVLQSLFPRWNDVLRRKDRDPDCFSPPEPSNLWLVIRSVGGVDATLGKAGAQLVSSLAAEGRLHAFAAIVDANHVGVAARTDSFRARYAPVFPDATRAVAGQVVDTSLDAATSTRIGLWVMPDNRRPGTADAWILDVARATRPDLVREAEAYVQAALPLSPPLASAEAQRKAALGAMGQADEPAGALASALRSGAWLPEPLPPSAQALAAFFDALTRPTSPPPRPPPGPAASPR